MMLKEAVSALNANTLHEAADYAGTRVDHVCASDLMSDVLVQERENLLLLTSLAAAQAVRTADVIGAVGVILVNGKSATKAMVDLAREFDLTLAGTELDMFHACVALGRVVGDGS